MAVYKHTYHGYSGRRTPGWRRWFILYREALRAIFHSKTLLAIYVLCFAFPLVDLVLIYLFNGTAFIAALGLPRLVTFTPTFFYAFAHYQCLVAFLFTAFAAPGLIAPDVANGGLSLYFARPLRRFEYLAGKMLALWVLLSALTWVPGLVLFAAECDMGGAAWRAQNLWIGWGMFVACWIWIVVISLVALAISAWIKWRVVAGAALLGIYFFGAGLGTAIDTVLRTQYGGLFNLMELHLIVWSAWFRLAPLTVGLETSAWAVLSALCVISIALILRKVRPLQVVK